MPVSIPLTGWSANDPVPSFLVEVAFAQGPQSSGAATYAILLLGNKTSAGSATADTVIYGPDTSTPLASTQDGANLFGLRSELYRMQKKTLAVNTTTPIYAVAVAESGGTAASLAITIATTAAANGVARVFVCDDFVDVQITSGDTAIVIAGNIVTAVSAKTDWPVTAANGGTAVVTLTAAQKGPRGNWLRAGISIIGTGVATTSSVGPMSFFTSGATLDSYTNALATILARRFYYIISADDGGQSSTNLTALCSQVTTQALPTNGIRQVVISGCNDATPANANTIAVACNNPRSEVYYLPAGDVPPCEMAASIGAGVAAYESGHGASTLNCDFFGQTTQTQPFWKIPTPRAPVVLTRTQVQSALNNGVSPIWLTSSNQTFLVSRITTKSQTSAVADYRIRDAHKVRVCDWFADDMQAQMLARFGGKVVADDPPNASVKPPQSAVFPALLKRLAGEMVDLYAANYLIDPAVAATIRAGINAVREVSNRTRLSCEIPLQPIDVLHSAGVYLAQVA